MEKKQFFSQLEKWPLIKFDHASIIQDGDSGTHGARSSLYAHDFNGNRAKLFIRHVPDGTDPVALEELYTSWIKEFKKAARRNE